MSKKKGLQIYMEKKFPELYGDSQVVCIHCLLKLLIRTPIFTCLLLLRITYRIMRMLMPIPQQPGQLAVTVGNRPDYRYQQWKYCCLYLALSVWLHMSGNAKKEGADP